MRRKTYESSLLKETYTEIRHRSGLTVCCFSHPGSTFRAVLTVGVGSVDRVCRNPSTGKTESFPAGIAHFMEHKLFAQPDGSDVMAAFSANGADVNAYTTAETTSYFFSCTGRFYESLELLLDFVTHPWFTEENVSAEAEIITQEILMYEDSPGARLNQSLLRGVYEKNPVRDPIAGTVDSVRTIRPSDLKRFYRAFYTPRNMILILSGELEEERTVELLDRTLPVRKGPERWQTLFPEEPRTVFRARTEEKGQTASPLVSVAFKDPEIPGDPAERMKRSEALSLLSDLLFSDTSEICSELYESGIIADKLSFDIEHSRNFSLMEVAAMTEQPDVFLERLLGSLSRIRDERSITEEELTRCKKVMYASAVSSFETFGLDFLTDCGDVRFDGGELFEQIRLMTTVTLSDLYGILDSLLSPDRTATAVLLPEEQEDPAGRQPEEQ